MPPAVSDRRFLFWGTEVSMNAATFPADLVRDVAKPPHVRDHFASGRGQDHADREAAAVRRRDPAGRHGEGAQERAPRDVGLDGSRKAARHFGHELGDAVRLRRPHDQPARHAGPPGFLRGHVPRADRRRRGGDGHRRGQGRGGADDQAARGVPAAQHADHHVRQQDGPRSARAAGAARGDRVGAGDRLRADHAGRSAWARRSAACSTCGTTAWCASRPARSAGTTTAR